MLVKVVSNVVNFDSKVLLEIIFYLFEPHDMATPPNINTYSVIDLISTLSIFQITLLYHSITFGKLL